MKVASHAFTLVELLVVISIIVILIALLFPAMDKAIREAEMAVCGTRQKTVATAGLIYTQDFRRSYPRPQVDRHEHADTDGEALWLETATSGSQPSLIGIANAPATDIRPLYEPYMPYDSYGCPLAPGVRYDKASNGADTTVDANYSIFMGWQYRRYDHFSAQTGTVIVDHRESYKAMYKLGDRWGFFDDWRGRYMDSNIVAMDRNLLGSWGTANVFGGQAPHPDDETLWDFFIWDTSPHGAATLTHTAWGYGYRGTLDVNAAYADGSVRRFNDLSRVNGVTAADERFDFAPAHADTWLAPNAKLMIPR